MIGHPFFPLIFLLSKRVPQLVTKYRKSAKREKNVKLPKFSILIDFSKQKDIFFNFKATKSL